MESEGKKGGGDGRNRGREEVWKGGGGSVREGGMVGG